MTLSEPRPAPGAMLGFFAWDLLVVVTFVVWGRGTHQETLDAGRSFQTALPFLIALLVAWLPATVRAHPGAWQSGIMVVAITAILGMALRRLVFDEGLSGLFPVVTLGYLGVLIIGARLLRPWVAARRGRSGS